MASQDGKRCRISASCTVKGSDYAGQFYIIVTSFVLIGEHYNIDLKDLLVQLDFYVLLSVYMADWSWKESIWEPSSFSIHRIS